MKFLKNFIIFFLFSIIVIFNFNINLVYGTVADDLLPGGCGYANTEYNQCCSESTTYNIEEVDLNNTLDKFKNCTLSEVQENHFNDLKSCGINDTEASIILRLLYTEKNEETKVKVVLCTRQYLLSQSESKKNNFSCNAGPFGSMTIGQLEDFFRSKRIIYNNMSDSEKLALQTSNSLTEDKCLINLGIAGVNARGLCVQDSVDYALRQIGKDPKIGAVINTQNELTTDTCVIGEPKEESGLCTCTAKTGLSILCNKYIKNPTEYNQCAACTESRGGLWTGFGCISLSLQGFIQETLFGWALGLAGIITLLCIIYAAFMLQTSAGNPERIKKARQYLTACITGLLLIVFSILILRIVGVDILKIPGFN